MTNFSRRQFLRTLAAGLVASTVDVDRLLWVPGEKTIFIPAPSLDIRGMEYHYVALDEQIEFLDYKDAYEGLFGGAAGGGKTALNDAIFRERLRMHRSWR